MWIKKEAPEFFASQQEIAKADVENGERYNQLIAELGIEKAGAIMLQRDPMPFGIRNVARLRLDLLKRIKNWTLPEPAVNRFLQSVQADLSDPEVSYVFVAIGSVSFASIEKYDDWFLRIQHRSENFFDAHVRYETLQPKLVKIA